MGDSPKASDEEAGPEPSKPVHLPRYLLPLLKVRVWLGERFKPTEVEITLIWAGLVGFLGGLSSLLFRAATAGCTIC